MRPRAIAVVITVAIMTAVASGQSLPNLFPLPNSSGLLETYNVNNAPISLTGAFFQSLGTSRRPCSSCHLPTQGRTVSAADVQLRFLLSQGLDPISGPTMVPTVTKTSIRQAYRNGARLTAYYSAGA
jgi:cytochrome c peroxidase